MGKMAVSGAPWKVAALATEERLVNQGSKTRYASKIQFSKAAPPATTTEGAAGTRMANATEAAGRSAGAAFQRQA